MAAACVVLLAIAVRAGLLVGADRMLLVALAPPASFVTLVLAVTSLGDSLVRAGITLVAVIVLAAAGRGRAAVVLASVVIGGAVLNWALKRIVLRPRPDLLPHLDHATGTSFPSGHAANAAILYLSLALLAPVRHRGVALAAAAVLAGAIGVSRVALAVHWPSDVAAGWCVGVGWVLLWRERPAWDHPARPERG